MATTSAAATPPTLKARIQKIWKFLLEIPMHVVRWIGTSVWARLIPGGLFLALTAAMIWRPDKLIQPIEVGVDMPSERAIPPSVPTPNANLHDIVHKFRFDPTGTDLRAGIPYWIFRIMPAMFRDELPNGWETLGFDLDDTTYYDKRPVPRGLTVSDSTVFVPFLHTDIKLARVSITCAGCHRGEYLDEKGERVLVDGMPNTTGRLQDFKRFFAKAFTTERFTAERVVTEIDNALVSDGRDKLNGKERLIYTFLVEYIRKSSADRVSKWMDSRADNGPGRIDPFNAVKFEVLQVPDDGTAATLDLPSIWNQREEIRSWHHFDGNTKSSSARNFGSVIGVGGIPLSVHQESITEIGKWIDALPPPAWPFKAPEAKSVELGKAIFTANCANCHGLYDRQRNAISEVNDSQYMKVVLDVGTDPERWKAFNQDTADALNGFGERNALWGPRAFRAAKSGYLAGPLDGIWARAPYLHNGSVPTIKDLLKEPSKRPTCFFRGNRHYDEAAMGWVSEVDKEGGRDLFRYCTEANGKTIAGNSNSGHTHSVPEAQQADLIAYLKTL